MSSTWQDRGESRELSHSTVQWQGTSGGHLVQALAQSRASFTVRAACWGLRPIKFQDRDFQTSLGNVFQCLTTVMMEKFFLYILSEFPLLHLVTIFILLLCSSEKNQTVQEHPYPCNARECKRIPAEQSPPGCTVLGLGKCHLLKGSCYCVGKQLQK